MGGGCGGADELPALARDVHAAFVKRTAEDVDGYEAVVTEHLRMSGVYWGLSALHLLGKAAVLDKDELLGWVLRCQHESGGFGGSEGHDAHILYTLSALQILAIYDELGRVDADRVAAYVAALQQPDGSVWGDEWGEVDTRFCYCALQSLALLGKLDKMDVKACTAYVGRCANFDGGFGCTPGGESHAGQVFTCVGALAIGQDLGRCNADLLGWWLAERQLQSGGLNGRPEKLPDVCYSWWVLSSLAILGRLHWIDRDALSGFILRCQDTEKGGISDRPDDEPDVFHTFFGLAGLSLMGYPDLAAIDPVYALPVDVVERLGLPAERHRPLAAPSS